MQQKIVVFGKGGIGKSTLTSNLAAVYAQRGHKVLLVGCDPKHDTTISLTGGVPIKTAVDLPGFMDLKARPEQFVFKGSLGVDCVESGGPEPGIGCAGRGISRTIEILQSCGLMKEGRYDVILFDVLGDVVCGGFAAPLRLGFADKVCIVASEELMALYAANNIARAIRNYSSNGIALCGIVANLKDPGPRHDVVDRFAAMVGTRVLARLPRDPRVREAEYHATTVIERSPACDFSLRVGELAEAVWSIDASKIAVPDPLSDREFHDQSRLGFRGPRRAPAPPPAGPAASPARRGGPPGAARAAKGADAPDERVEKALAVWAALDKGGWVDGPHAKQWGSSDQWRNFYCDREASRNADQQVYVDAPMIGIAHEDLECHYATPYFNDGYIAFFNFSWLERWGIEERFTKSCFGFTTDLRDRDVVQGGSARLQEALDLAVERKEGKSAILVTSTCIPTVIGDDAQGIIAQYEKKAGLPILFSSPAGGQELNLLEHFFAQVRSKPEFKDVRPLPGHVNLIGFPVGDSRGELAELLRSCGLTVNAWLLPRLDLEDAARFGRAELNVLFPNPAFEELYRKLFAGLGRTVVPPSPYGLEGTRRWLAAVAEPLGRAEEARRAWEALAAELSGDWEQARGRVEGRRLAFVADPAQVAKLADPRGPAGIPLVPMLKEMGFGVDYLVYHAGRRPELEGASGGRHGLSWFSAPAELERLLEEGAFDAVYSEFFFDRRLTAAGKAQFSIPDVELGAKGALRSLQRLGRICRWPFYKRYRRCLPKPVFAPPAAGGKGGKACT